MKRNFKIGGMIFLWIMSLILAFGADNTNGGLICLVGAMVIGGYNENKADNS